MKNTFYNKRTFLNKEDSPSTGNVVAFDGITKWHEENVRNIFLSISDCNVSVRLHKIDDDSVQDFIDKLQMLKYEIEMFVEHLEKNKE